MRRRGEIRAAAAIAAAAVGPGIVTGRETAGFFSQTAGSAWLGIVCAGTLFGLLAAGLLRLQKSTGARSLLQLRRRMPGAGGTAVCAFHGLILAAVMFLTLTSAWEIGALLLPFHGGGAAGAGIALLLAIGILLLPMDAQIRACAANLALVLLFEAALAAFGKLPAASGTYAAVDLRLAGSNPAAVLLGAIHASLRVCIAANAVLRFAEPGARPLRTGLRAGGCYAACLAVGNFAICRQSDFVAALRMPLTVLATGWGRFGFYTVALLTFFASVIGLYAALLAFFDVKL